MSYRVYFGRLPDSLSQDEFEKILAEHGKARNIEWKSGYAYVDYKHGSDASKTVQNLNGKEVGGNNILVELAQNGAGGGYAVAGAFAPRPFVKPPLPRPIRTPHRVRIENLSSRAKWMELKELLSLAGEVTFADTHKRVTGEGIVEFATRKDMDEAIKTFHNTTFYGKTIKLYDESPRSRSRSPPSESKSRSHSRHRSTEKKRQSPSKSTSPRRKSTSSRRRSRSPRRRSRRSHSRDGNKSSKRRESRSRTPKRNSHKKSKRRSSPYSKSPKRNKHKRSRSSSHSNSDNNNDSKRKSKTKGKKKHSSDIPSSNSSNSD